MDSEAVMTKITNIFGYTKDTSASKDMGVWNLDTADMTLAELEEYKKELQRLDERDRSRRNRGSGDRSRRDRNCRDRGSGDRGHGDRNCGNGNCRNGTRQIGSRGGSRFRGYKQTGRRRQ